MRRKPPFDLPGVAQRDPQLRLLVTRHRMMASRERGPDGPSWLHAVATDLPPRPRAGDFLIPIKFVEVSQLSP